MPRKKHSFFSAKLHRLNRWWLEYEYKHTTIAILGIAAFVLLLDTALLASVFSFIEGLGYAGGFLAGVLSVSFFTAAPALVLVIEMAQHFDPLPLALVVGLGSAIGDYIIMLIFTERVFDELRPLGVRLRLVKTIKQAKKKRSAKLLLLGTLFISSPLPDEIGLSILGISHFPKIVIFIICLGLNTLGAALVILTTRALT